MRLKSVPVVGSLAKASPLLIAGAAVAIGGIGYAVYKNRAAASADASTETAASGYGVAGLTAPNSQSPVSLAGLGGASSSGSDTLSSVSGDAASTVSASTPVATGSNEGTVYKGFAGGIDPATQALIDLEYLKEKDAYSFNMTALAVNYQTTQDTLATNAYIATQQLQSLNYQAAASLASTFMTSSNQLSQGVITGPDGAPVLQFSMMQERNSKKNGWNNTLAQSINSGVVAKFWDSIPGVSGQAGSGVSNPAAPAVYSPFAISPAVQALLSGNYGGSTTPAPVSTPAITSAPAAIAAPVATVAPRAVASPTAKPSYTAYVEANSDLLALFNSHKGMAKGKTEEQFGLYHYQNYGQKEGRALPA